MMRKQGKVSSPERYSTEKTAAVEVSDSRLLQIHEVLWHIQHHTNTRLQPLGGSAVVKSRQQHLLSLLTPIGASNSCESLHSILALPQLISKKKKVSPEAASPLFCKDDGLSHLPASLLQIQRKGKNTSKSQLSFMQS